MAINWLAPPANEFSPRNSFRWRLLDWHGERALQVVRVRRRSDNFVIKIEAGEDDGSLLERGRLKCVEMDRNAGFAA